MRFITHPLTKVGAIPPEEAAELVRLLEVRFTAGAEAMRSGGDLQLIAGSPDNLAHLHGLQDAIRRIEEKMIALHARHKADGQPKTSGLVAAMAALEEMEMAVIIAMESDEVRRAQLAIEFGLPLSKAL
jgi:hypothetical protein